MCDGVHCSHVDLDSEGGQYVGGCICGEIVGKVC